MVTSAMAEERVQPVLADSLAEHRPVLLAAARLISKNEADAQDAVQATFEIALRRGNTLRDTTALRAWLLAIGAREAVRRASLMRRFISWSPVVHDVSVLGPDHDELLALRAGVRRLPTRVRAAIALHYLAGYSVRDTATALGVSENTIKTQVKKGLASLREELSDE
jgi:DNA-directed RNA polymerase specialized sigma24 family protein